MPRQETRPVCPFIVIAHTNDENIYWVSDVAAACNYDNLTRRAGWTARYCLTNRMHLHAPFMAGS